MAIEVVWAEVRAAWRQKRVARDDEWRADRTSALFGLHLRVFGLPNPDSVYLKDQAKLGKAGRHINNSILGPESCSCLPRLLHLLYLTVVGESWLGIFCPYLTRVP